MFCHFRVLSFFVVTDLLDLLWLVGLVCGGFYCLLWLQGVCLYLDLWLLVVACSLFCVVLVNRCVALDLVGLLFGVKFDWLF